MGANCECSDQHDTVTSKTRLLKGRGSQAGNARYLRCSAFASEVQSSGTTR